MQKLQTKVWRGNRPHLSVRIHPDLMDLLRNLAKSEKLSLSQSADEILYRGFVAEGMLSEK